MTDTRAHKMAAARSARETLRELAAGLVTLGYRERDAEFVVAAALTGGYFLRRQYRAFSGCRKGRAELRLLRCAEANRHVRAAFPGHSRRETLYQLRGSSLRKALGPAAGEVRGRARARRWVKQHLLALDHFIGSEDGRWLLHAGEKAAFFRSLGIPEALLPAAPRTRNGKRILFPDAFPIQVADGDGPTVAFSYAHAEATEAGMLRHLQRHEPLAGALASRGIGIDLAVLADSAVQFLRLRRAWRKWAGRVERDWKEAQLFELRRRVDKRRWKALSLESIQRYADLRAAHDGEGAERRYRAWIANGAPQRDPGPCPTASCTYREVLLDHDYRAADLVAARG